MAGVYGAPPSSVTGVAPDSEEVSHFLNQIIHNSSSSCMASTTRDLPFPLISPPPDTAGIFRTGDHCIFGQSTNHSDSDCLLRRGNLSAASDAFADSSSSFNFPDPGGYISKDVKETTDYALSSAGFDDSDTKTNLIGSWFPSENNTGVADSGNVDQDTSELPSKPVEHRTSSKRSRTAEFHNLSEKRRRSRINEKMKDLQKLIPNSNKTDKVSMLDEAIEYLKQLQLQVQMLSMRNGLSLQPICFPGVMHPIVFPQTGLSFNEDSGFQSFSRVDTLSVNDERVAQSALNLIKQCTISGQPLAPSVTDIATSETASSFGPRPFQVHAEQFHPFKDACSDGTQHVVLDTSKIGGS